MATPLVATNRVTFKYTVTGLPHVTRLYCSVVTPGTGGASTILDHDAVTLHTLTQVAGVAAAALDFVAPDSGGNYEVDLEARVGSLWFVIDSVSVATGHGTVNGLGWQGTLVFRASDRTKIKLVQMEGAPGVLAHTTNPTGSTATVNALIAVCTTGVQSTHNIFRWVVGRSGNFMATTTAFVGFTSAGNRKVRRARHLT